jgi:putative FmdB family regulatory protein
MPTYDFTCPEGHETEKFYRSIASAPAEIPCPVCGEPAVRQVSGGAGLLFKGSGFYITDYGKDGKKDLKSAKPSTSTGEAAGGSKGADAAAPSTPAPAPSTPPKSTE